MNLPVLFEKYPKVRSWIYGILWLGLITATFPGGVAFTNRPTGPTRSGS